MSDDELPLPGDRVRVTVRAGGRVIEGEVLAQMRYWGGGWSLTVQADAGGSIGITDDDVAAGRMDWERL